MSTKSKQPPDNPCLNEQNISLKCLSENDYDKRRCEVYFANYTHCMKFFTQIKFDRRRKGITPEVPPLEERERLKAEYLQSVNSKRSN